MPGDQAGQDFHLAFGDGRALGFGEAADVAVGKADVGLDLIELGLQALGHLGFEVVERGDADAVVRERSGVDRVVEAVLGDHPPGRGEQAGPGRGLLLGAAAGRGGGARTSAGLHAREHTH